MELEIKYKGIGEADGLNVLFDTKHLHAGNSPADKVFTHKSLTDRNWSLQISDEG